MANVTMYVEQRSDPGWAVSRTSKARMEGGERNRGGRNKNSFIVLVCLLAGRGLSSFWTASAAATSSRRVWLGQARKVGYCPNL